jgi:hypothetical protein
LSDAQFYINFILRERSILPNVLEDAEAGEPMEGEQENGPLKPDVDIFAYKAAIGSPKFADYLHELSERHKGRHGVKTSA